MKSLSCLLVASILIFSSLEAMPTVTNSTAQNFDTVGLLMTIDGQIWAFREENWKKAYEEFCCFDFRYEHSFDDFLRFIHQFSVLRENAAIALGRLYFKEQLGVYEGTITSTNGESAKIQYLLMKERGKWRICSIQVLNTT